MESVLTPFRSLMPSLNWTGMYSSNYFMDEGIKPGIEIWSYGSKMKQRDVIAAAFERATKGRLKISSHRWPLDARTTPRPT
jgi:hypothetical protein